ncbi:MAG: nicotinate phosphoribosyltransferase [Persephonella sp.]|nr:MAG: nicotinate phosphoribosyltransferase [Persephonella sp.]RUM61337.1 MAG: nicotinate phosphoribosyltransferase [Persephonella sp.]
MFNRKKISMLTDLYELTMAYVYFKTNENGRAVFNFYIRPTEKRNFFIFAGLYELIKNILEMKFYDEDIEYLKSLNKFSDDFLDYLKKFRFSGNLFAVDEGSIVFPNEPLVQIEAPLVEAQIIETFLINSLQLPILIATKSARCYTVANNKILVDFSLRRTQGFDAGLKVAYSSYIAGFNGTSNILAGELYKIPVFGTMAHSFILAYGDEEKAFKEFAKLYPNDTVFLVDTFNTVEGIKRAVKVIKELGLNKLKGIRIDSGDLVELSKIGREILDMEGFKDSIIFVSGGLNEYKIEKLLREGAKIDGFGVGTELGVSADLPYLDCVYKLAEYRGKPIAKFSKNKTTFPYKKQIYRVYRDGYIHQDTVSHFDEKLEGEPLVKQFIKDGKLVGDIPSISKIRDFTLSQIETLPPNLKDLNNYHKFLPTFTPKIIKTIEELKKKYLS